MPARFAHPTDPSAPLVWRVPAWQPTFMMLFVCGVVALNLYLSPNTLVRIVTIGLGGLAFIAAIEGLRMYLVADKYGIGFRGLLRTHNIDWSDIQSISVRRSGFNGPTLRITRTDGSYADVPPSLMLPTKPTGTVKALAQLGDTARMITDYGQARR
jgi:Bacterial PH domain